MRVQTEVFLGPRVVRFLRHIQGKLLVIWDGAPLRRPQVVKTFLSDGVRSAYGWSWCQGMRPT